MRKKEPLNQALLLYEYFEDKISKKQKAIEDEQKELEASKTVEQPKATKKSCGCC